MYCKTSIVVSINVIFGTAIDLPESSATSFYPDEQPIMDTRSGGNEEASIPSCLFMKGSLVKSKVRPLHILGISHGQLTIISPWPSFQVFRWSGNAVRRNRISRSRITSHFFPCRWICSHRYSLVRKEETSIPSWSSQVEMRNECWKGQGWPL